jgi:predicted Fe-Mo cluster-binding NifX family protein
MKVAVSSAGPGLNSEASPIFGRCPYFIIVEIAGNEIKGHVDIQNQAMMQAGGAGIMAAQTVGNQGVKSVISGAVGPRAFAVLQQLGIEMYAGTAGTVKQNVEQFVAGKLKKLSVPGPMGFGMGGGMGRGRGMGRGLGGGFGAGRGRRWQQ